MQGPLSVQDAWQTLEQHCPVLEPHPYPLLESVGLVLAETPRADLDMPAFALSAVDGLAVKQSDTRPGRQLEVIEEVAAGCEPQRRVEPGKAIRVMTGAPLPEGADMVLKVQHTKALGRRCVEVIQTGDDDGNIVAQGEQLRRGQVVLGAEIPIEPKHVALLAAQGHLRLLCHRRPRVAVLATGNEVIAPNRVPKGAQVRNVNNLMLVSSVASQNALGHDLGTCPDEEVSLGLAIRRALTSDLVLISGGGSAGVRDLVPRICAEEGVRPVFHNVAVTPGHLVWFGMHGQKPVFGLPGSPVSVLICFELFVRPALRRMMGLQPAVLPRVWTQWAGPSLSPHPRMRAVGVSWHQEATTPGVCPVASRGSSDVQALSRFEALALLPAEKLIAPGLQVQSLALTRQPVAENRLTNLSSR